ncbi:hypothetical protein BpHYR1_010525 [Brachionus plicatilis]|uniref:Uncharacterized protein n=1 Tax=Brachionus plicatilis TaxID=10195 RepID=A0A3M7PPG2_BRAPC|nr:hypothetical protein BpHYR1_010525 [Brachionus plicatilis]
MLKILFNTKIGAQMLYKKNNLRLMILKKSIEKITKKIIPGIAFGSKSEKSYSNELFKASLSIFEIDFS